MLQVISVLFFALAGFGAGAFIVATLGANADKIAVALRLRQRAFVPAPPPMRIRARIVRGAAPVRTAEQPLSAAA